ncbi:unnamed protein product [Albugo candida]|uniref:Uncharacterized protein n=1 Tax=Albugo candida TaxID=65357 RepID=A0A024GR30_9STRA|nr:unnamed protein product [Albugo candida]|eukprot:CCI48987.1 unnamed protein product [Albugo candida]
MFEVPNCIPVECRLRSDVYKTEMKNSVIWKQKYQTDTTIPSFWNQAIPMSDATKQAFLCLWVVLRLLIRLRIGKVLLGFPYQTHTSTIDASVIVNKIYRCDSVAVDIDFFLS